MAYMFIPFLSSAVAAVELMQRRTGDKRIPVLVPPPLHKPHRERTKEEDTLILMPPEPPSSSSDPEEPPSSSSSSSSDSYPEEPPSSSDSDTETGTEKKQKKKKKKKKNKNKNKGSDHEAAQDRASYVDKKMKMLKGGTKSVVLAPAPVYKVKELGKKEEAVLVASKRRPLPEPLKPWRHRSTNSDGEIPLNLNPPGLRSSNGSGSDHHNKKNEKTKKKLEEKMMMMKMRMQN